MMIDIPGQVQQQQRGIQMIEKTMKVIRCGMIMSIVYVLSLV